MDEPTRKVYSEASGVVEIDGEADGSGKGRREPQPPRAGSAVSLEIRKDEAESSPGQDVQKGERARVPLKKPRVITDKQRALVKEYLTNGKKKVDAYKKVYGEGNPKHVKITAHRAFLGPAVQYMLMTGEYKAATKIEGVLAKYAITEARIAEELAKIAFSDPKDVMEWGPDGVKVKDSKDLNSTVSGSVSEIRETKSGLTVKQHDKIQALVTLGKTIGMFREQVEHKHMVAAKLIIDTGD